MASLITAMNSAQSIDFLHTYTFDKPDKSDWRLLRKLPFGRRLLKPIVTRQTLYAEDGGFVFAQRPAVSLQSGVATGLIGTLLFGVVGASIAIGSIRPEAIVLPSSTMTHEGSPLMSQATELAIGQSNLITKEEALASQPTIPPTKSIATTAPAPESTKAAKKLNRTVFGFLPYWFVEPADGNIDYSLLTTLAYFDIGMNADGSFDTSAPGWKKLSSPTTQRIFSEARQADTRIVLTFTSFDDEVIENISQNQAAGDRAISNMLELAKKEKVGGINIDFEYVGSARPELRVAFTRFVQRATEQFHQSIPDSEVTVSTYAASAKWSKLYEVAPLANASDGLFIMGYDYSTVNSDRVGPVAPLTGAPDTYWYDITSAVEDFLAKDVPSDKMILGVPYYGYDWPASGQSPKSAVAPGRAHTANYSAVKEAIEKGIGTEKWDYEAQVPYLTYAENGVNRIAYYENEKSLGLKYDLINEKNLKGAGIWALGQEGSRKELWGLLEKKFGHNAE